MLYKTHSHSFYSHMHVGLLSILEGLFLIFSFGQFGVNLVFPVIAQRELKFLENRKMG